jgi:hypothetical protein
LLKKGDMDEALLLEFYSFVIGFCFVNLIYRMLVCDLRNHFCLKWNNIPLFGDTIHPSKNLAKTD